MRPEQYHRNTHKLRAAAVVHSFSRDNLWLYRDTVVITNNWMDLESMIIFADRRLARAWHPRILLTFGAVRSAGGGVGGGSEVVGSFSLFKLNPEIEELALCGQ